MKIKKFNDFIKEEVSGTELVGQIGPGYGDTRLQNKTINSHDTNVIFCDIDSKFYTIDDYNNIYGEHLKNGGKPLDGFSLENIIEIVSKL
jgi:hypothetical protein